MRTSSKYRPSLTSASPLQAYAFGSVIPEFSYKNVAENDKARYRYGFNGEELENLIAGDGLVYDLGARFYDGRLGRMFSLDPLMQKYPYWAPYSYCGNNPIWVIDVDGLSPGDTFSTVDMAAKDFAMLYNDNSIQEDVEYGAYIYKFRSNGSVYYTYNIPTKSHTSAGVAIKKKGVPFFRKILAIVHSHGAHANGNHEINNFSLGDKNISRSKGIPIYVSTPNGMLKKYNPISDKVSIINNRIPSDPAERYRVNKLNYNDYPKNEPFQKRSKLWIFLFDKDWEFKLNRNNSPQNLHDES